MLDVGRGSQLHWDGKPTVQEIQLEHDRGRLSMRGGSGHGQWRQPRGTRELAVSGTKQACGNRQRSLRLRAYSGLQNILQLNVFNPEYISLKSIWDWQESYRSRLSQHPNLPNQDMSFNSSSGLFVLFLNSNTLIFFSPPSETDFHSDHQNYKRTHLCCLTPLCMWSFVTAALGN